MLEFLQRVGQMLVAAAQVFRSRYVRELEAENARLRDREAALLNTILVSRGLPPLTRDPAKRDEQKMKPGPRPWSVIRSEWEAKDSALHHTMQGGQTTGKDAAPKA